MIFLKMDIHFPKQYFPGNLRDSVYTSHKLWKYRSTNTIILFLSILLVVFNVKSVYYIHQKQPPRVDLNKRYSENMQQIYRRTPMAKCGFNNVAF